MKIRDKLLVSAATIALTAGVSAPARATMQFAMESAAVYSENVQSMQTIMAQLGFYPADQVSGYMNQQTREAISQFQTAYGLRPTGVVDQETARLINDVYFAGQAPAPQPQAQPQPSQQELDQFAEAANEIEPAFGPLLEPTSLFWTAAAGGAVAGGAIAASGGDSAVSGASISNPIDFGIPSNDAGDQSYDGTFVAANLDNPASGTPANFLLGDAAVADSLPLINAQFAQARGYDGRVYHRSSTGALLNSAFDDYVVVAVVDTGIDLDHPDLDDNIVVNASVTCAYFNCVAGGDDLAGHGTSVAGLIAAEDNEIGTVGVAPQAKLLSVAAPDLLVGDVAVGYDYLNNKGVDVINNSYGSQFSSVAATKGFQSGVQSEATTRSVLTLNAGLTGVSFLEEIQQAVSQHTILVWAAGNDSSDQPSVEASLPYYFNGTVGDANLEGYDWSNNWVAAVFLNDNLSLNVFSNGCGIAQEYCLAAPGSVYTTDMGGGYSEHDGTSFAAPNVSGAIAVMLGAYPHLQPETILQILFETATDLGDAGTDIVYGRGLVNLNAATNPTGNSADWTVALAQNASFAASSFSATGFNFSTAFGDAISSNNQNILFLDSYGKDYLTPISTFFGASASKKNSDELLNEFAETKLDNSLNFNSGTDVSFSLDARSDEARRMSGTNRDLSKVEWRQSIADNKTEQVFANFGYNVNAAEFSGLATLDGDGQVAQNFQLSDAFKNPYLNFAEYAQANSLDYKAHGLALRLTNFSGEFEREEFEFADSNNLSGQVVEVGLLNKSGLSLSAQAGLVNEAATFLGSESGGAMQFENGAKTRFAGIAASYEPVQDILLKANFVAGKTAVKASEASLITNVSEVDSSSFGLGLEWQNARVAGDKLGFSVSQPLRVSSGSANISLPQDVLADGSYVYQDSTLNLAAQGQEMDFGAFYNLAYSGNSEISIGSVLRLQPDNVADASNEGLVVARLKSEF